MDCIFCRMARKEIVPSEVLHEDEETLAFLDIHPRAPGHTVIIPKVHAENILELPNEKIQPFFLTVKTITAILLRGLRPDGFTLGINHGRVGGAEVPHLHLHVMPRFKDDGGGSIHSVVNNISRESIHDIAKKIRTANQ